MMFRRVSLRYFRTQKLRTGITIGGIALGVATMVAIQLLTDAAPRAYERMIERFAGRADFQLTNGEVGVPESLLDEVRSVTGVAQAVAVVQGFVPVASLPGEYLSIFGVDLLEDRNVRDYEGVVVEEEAGDPLAFLAEPDSVSLTSRFLDEHGLGLGHRIVVSPPRGPQELEVRSRLGIRSGPASLFGGRLAVMDLYAAQALLALDGRFTWIDVVVSDAADPAVVRSALVERAGGRAVVEAPSARGETLGTLLRSYRTTATLSSLMAMGIGLYLVFNTMMVAVVQRRREIGMLRSIGMTRGGVTRLVLGESLALGTAGCLVGVPLGLALAWGLAPVVSGDVFRTYRLSFDALDLTPRLAPVLWGSGLALLNAGLAGVLPAREAARVPPAEALRRAVSPPAEATDPYRRLAFWGLILVAVSSALWMVRARLAIETHLLAAIVIVTRWLGVGSTVPWLIRAAVRRVERPLAALFGFPGAAASRDLVRHLDRVAVTGLAFFLSLAGAIVIAAQLSSFQYTIARSIDLWFANAGVAVFSNGVPASLAPEMARIPGVEAVGVIRSVRVGYEGSLVALAARGTEPSDRETALRSLDHVEILDGDRAAVLERFVAGEGVLVNEAFATRFRRGPGDVVVLQAPSGEARLPILATYWDSFLGNLGIILVEGSRYRSLWNDPVANTFELHLRASTTPGTVAGVIRRNWGKDHPLFVYTLADFRREVEAGIAQGFAIATTMMVISFGIAVLGIVNSLLATVLDRVREIGILRAVGATRLQIAASVLIEAVTIGAVGAALAGVIGAVLGTVEVDVIYGGLWSIRVLYDFPTTGLLVGCVGGVVFAALAGFLPARRAAALRPAEALRYE